MNNIFTHSPKELTTDGFLKWYFIELGENPDLKDKAASFFYELGLCENKTDIINDIHVETQENKTDLTVRYRVNNKETQALFENKTYSTIHSDQLEKYKEQFPGFKYKYMKLGFINYSEDCEARNAKYAVIDVYKLKTALESVPFNNCIVDQYKDFLDSQYIEVLDDIKQNLINNNEYESFKNEHGQAQQYILSELHKSIDGLSPDIKFTYAANRDGSPWVQLDIAKREKAYGDEAEYLFWRIDKRAKGYYLRLNQYSYIDNQFWRQKEKNLGFLKDNVSHLFEEKRLVLGRTSNRGKKESEVVILFFKDNQLSTVSQALPKLSKEINEFYKSTSSWK